MKKTAALILALIFLTQSGLKFFTFLDFTLNKNYYEKVLCVKKEVVNNCCKGSCQVKLVFTEIEKNNSSKNYPSTKNAKELDAINPEKTTSFIFQENLIQEFRKIASSTSIVDIEKFIPPPEFLA